MHASSMQHMQDLLQRYLDPQTPLAMADIGSYDVNGSYRALTGHTQWRYTGVDLEPGPNVDVVMESPYRLPFATASMDVLISGQALEHMDFFWVSWLEMIRVVRPGGLIFMIAPSRGPEHRYPVDCWRFYPDGFDALARWGGADSVEISTDWSPHEDPASAVWGDTVGVFRVSAAGWRHRIARDLILRLSRRMLRSRLGTTRPLHAGRDRGPGAMGGAALEG
jgi:SAM-dependent methyltransferase